MAAKAPPTARANAERQSSWRPTGSLNRHLRRQVAIVAVPSFLIALLPLLWHVVVEHRGMLIGHVNLAIDQNRQRAVEELNVARESGVKAVAARIAEITDASLVRISDTDGTIVAEFSRAADASRAEDTNLPAWQRAVLDYLPEIPLAALEISRDLDINGDPVGSVEVMVSRPPLLEIAMMPLFLALFVMLPVAVFAFVIVSRMRRKIVEPFSHLLETMDQVAHFQDYSIRARVGGPDEIGSLIISFNETLQQIDTRNKHLADHRRKLQELVIERTRNFEDAARQAEKASQAKGDFLARMSHEIRTPMNGVVGMAELLESTKLADQQVRMVHTMRSSADALLDIINDILDFSKIEAGQLKVLETQFSPVDILEEVCELLAPQAHQRDLELVCDIAAAVPDKCGGDPIRFRQIVVNLLGNAIKYTEKGRVIVRAGIVSQTGAKAQLRIEIEDTGLGVPEEQLETIFEAFTQADSFETRKHGGTGLGLAITRELVTLLGGEVGASSRLGVGSTFWVRLPLSIPKEEPTARAPFDAGVGSVLIVQSDEFAAKATTALLQAGGARTWTRQTGYAAIDALAIDTFSLILIDELLPDMSGPDLIDRIRSIKDAAASRIVLMTSSKRPATASDGVQHSSAPDARLDKPVRRMQLRRAIERAFGRGDVDDQTVPANAEQERLDLRILLVEDSPVNREVACGMLESMGCTVENADDGSVGVEQALSWKFDLVLMDCQMPLMDGFEATRRIRMAEAASSRKPVPIVALTANALQGDRERCLDAGMNDFISKPFTMKKLYDVLWAATRASSGDTVAAVATEADTSPKGAVSATEAEPVERLPAGSDLPIVDAAQIEELRSLGRPQLVERAIALFLTQAEATLDELDVALNAGSIADLERLAHALKSAALSVGGRHFASLAGDCEQAARGGDLQTAVRVAGGLRLEYNCLQDALERIAASQVAAA